MQCLWECKGHDDFGGEFSKITLEVLSMKITYTYSLLDSAIPLWEPLLKRHITVIANFSKHHLCSSLLEIFIVLKLDLHIEWPNKKANILSYQALAFKNTVHSSFMLFEIQSKINVSPKGVGITFWCFLFQLTQKYTFRKHTTQSNISSW